MTSHQQNPLGLNMLRIWLFIMAGLISVLVLVGGATRLTGSGLSITEWRPLIGIIPPLSEVDWQEVFAKYREIPQYKLVNQGMGLSAFKWIFWWEWSHRFLARFIGLAFLVPMIGFWLKGVLSPLLKRRLLALFVLGGLQGVMGWYMVKSGLSVRVEVSQYRLAAHLALAIVIIAGILWTAFGLKRYAKQSKSVWAPGALLAALLLFSVFVQIILGAFVAGLNAGKGYTSWPLIDGAVIPDGLFELSPLVLNFFENALTVQFFHRMTAYFIVVLAALHALEQWREGKQADPAGAFFMVFVLVLGQASLGVWTLVNAAPIDLSLAHQAGSLVLLYGLLWHFSRLRISKT